MTTTTAPSTRQIRCPADEIPSSTSREGRTIGPDACANSTAPATNIAAVRARGGRTKAHSNAAPIVSAVKAIAARAVSHPTGKPAATRATPAIQASMTRVGM